MRKGYAELRVWFFIAPFFLWISLFAYDGVYADYKKDLTLPTPDVQHVTIENHAFTPQTITISVNTTVTWVNKDDMKHTVTSETGLFSSDGIPPGGTYDYQFKTAGVYKYHCKYHEQMIATVVVQ